MPRLITGLPRFHSAIARAAFAVARRRREFVDDLRRDVVLDRHAVRRDVARRRAVEVRAPDVERIAAERARDLVEHVLDREHALRPAEAAERRVGDGVGPAAVAVQRDVGQPVRVVDVEHRAVVDRARQVRREAAARREHEVEPEDPALARRSRRRTCTRTHGACPSSACRRRGRAAASRRGPSCARRSRRRRRTATSASPCRRSRRPCAGIRRRRRARRSPARARPCAAPRRDAASTCTRACRRARAAPRARSAPRGRSGPGRRSARCRAAGAAPARARRRRRRASRAPGAARTTAPPARRRS